MAFFKQWSFRRVKIFGFTLIQYASAKANDLPAHIDDGEHNAIPKAIVTLVTLAFYHESGLDQTCILIVGYSGIKVLPSIRRITDTEARSDFAAQATFL